MLWSRPGSEPHDMSTELNDANMSGCKGSSKTQIMDVEEGFRDRLFPGFLRLCRVSGQGFLLQGIISTLECRPASRICLEEFGNLVSGSREIYTVRRA